jgi:hypothetical protein
MRQDQTFLFFNYLVNHTMRQSGLFQISVIKRNLHHFDNSIMDSTYFITDVMRLELAEEWMTLFQVEKLPERSRLFNSGAQVIQEGLQLIAVKAASL